ncbi:MAG: formylglycine-generating enzyme family protein [Spirochaetales bacterium]|jgi:formylglycine-generating enzyme required for sulfatase activity|nr:formylglycine-generating enzyme family protein [Spirochaetales bacterium]
MKIFFCYPLAFLLFLCAACRSFPPSGEVSGTEEVPVVEEETAAEEKRFFLPGLGERFVFASENPVIYWENEASAFVQIQAASTEDFAPESLVFDAETRKDFMPLPLALNEESLFFLRARRRAPGWDWEDWSPSVAVSFKPLRPPFMRTIVPPEGRAEFLMGSGSGKLFEQPEHTETLTQGYEMAVYEMTNSFLAEILNRVFPGGEIYVRGGVVYGRDALPYLGLGELNYGFQFGIELAGKEGEERFVPLQGKAEHPSVGLSWYGAAFVCDVLSRMYGYRPAYGSISSGSTANREAGGFRLPSEAEWEYAARGDSGQLYPARAGRLEGRAANFLHSGGPFDTRAEAPSASGGPTTPSGFYNGSETRGYKTLNAVSAFGLYDMLGNVWEWCDDFFVDEAEEETGRGEERRFRSCRGGAWNTPAREVSFACRGRYKIEGLSYSLGMRLCRSLFAEETVSAPVQ